MTIFLRIALTVLLLVYLPSGWTGLALMFLWLALDSRRGANG
jgi:hypothetical protein